MSDEDKLSPELENDLAKGRKLLIISCDEQMGLEMEECTFPGWAIAGVASWLELVAESTMFEEMADEAEAEDE